MIKIDKVEIAGWGPSIRGMRNPLQSWDKIDSGLQVMNPEDVEFGYEPNYEFIVGKNDKTLMNSLATAGTDHSKFSRMLTVWCDITAPLYWWKEFDTYRMGVEKNSSSTMHTIHMREFTLDDFSHEHLIGDEDLALYYGEWFPPTEVLNLIIKHLNGARKDYLETKDKKYWWQMIQLLPSSYNQLRTVQMSYQALSNMYKARHSHRLDEWHTFCDWVETLPYFKEIYLESLHE